MLIVALLVAAAVVAGAILTLLRPTLPAAVLLALLSAAWWPVNNRVLEGPTLLTLNACHGLTVADLLGLAGAVVAVIGIGRCPHQGIRRTVALVVVVIAVGVGWTIAYVTG